MHIQYIFNKYSMHIQYIFIKFTIYIAKSIPKFIEAIKTNYVAHLRSEIRKEYGQIKDYNDISLQNLDDEFNTIFDRNIISQSYRGLMLSYLPKVLSKADDIIAESAWVFDVSWDASHAAGSIVNIRASKYMSLVNI